MNGKKAKLLRKEARGTVSGGVEIEAAIRQIYKGLKKEYKKGEK